MLVRMMKPPRAASSVVNTERSGRQERGTDSVARTVACHPRQGDGPCDETPAPFAFVSEGATRAQERHGSKIGASRDVASHGHLGLRQSELPLVGRLEERFA